jgi:hypothetical protein
METTMATFAEEFKKQRAMKGSGKTFEYKGKTYTTDTADDKKVGPAKPKARPAGLNPKSGAAQSGTAGKVEPKGLGSRIMDASANAGKFLGEKAAAIANYGKDKPKPRTGTTSEYKSGGVVKKAAGGMMKMVEKGGKNVPAFAADGVGKMKEGGMSSLSLRGKNRDAHLEKSNQNQAENPGLFSGTIKRGLRGKAINDTKAQSDKLIDTYGADAAKSRGFMAYDKPTAAVKSKSKTVAKAPNRSEVMKKAAGGMIKEGTAKDMREDKAMAKKAGLTMKQHEASAADKKHDAPSKMKTGGGVMRGAGAATRGKKFSGSF